MARKYKIEGTKSYLVGMIVCLLLAAWFAWDGWLPRASVLAAHPDATDHFYLFNKSMAILFLLGSMVSGVIHLMVR